MVLATDYNGGAGSSSEEKKPVTLPQNEIFYFRNGNVEVVKTYCLVNSTFVADTLFRRWGSKYFMSSFDEYHGIDVSDLEITVDRLPDRIRDIFEAKNRESVRQNRSANGPMRYFIDRN